MLKFSKTSSFLHNYISSILQVVITTLCYLFVSYIVLSKLGKSELGTWSIISSIPFTITQIGSGVSGTLMRYVPKYVLNGDRKGFNLIVFNALIVNLIIGIIITIIGIVFARDILLILIGFDNLKTVHISHFHISLVTFLINFLGSVLVATFDGLQLINKRNYILIIGSMVFVSMTLILMPKYGVSGVFYGQLFQSVVVLVSLALLITRSDLYSKRYLRGDRNCVNLFFSYGWKLQMISVSIIFFDPVTKYFLNRFYGLASVGVYDLAYRGISQLRLLIVSGGQVIVPKITLLENNGFLLISDLYLKAVRGMRLLSLILFSIYIPLSLFLYKMVDSGSIQIFTYTTLLLFFGYHINIISTPAYSVLMGLGKLKNLLISHGVSSGLNFLLFLGLGKMLPPTLMGIPMVIAVIASSVVLMRLVKKEGIFSTSTWLHEKQLEIYIIILLLFTTYVLLNFSVGYYHLVFFYLVHSLVLYVLLRRNDYVLFVCAKFSTEFVKKEVRTNVITKRFSQR